SAADDITKQLRSLSNPVSLAGETQAFGALTASHVMSSAQALKFLPRLNDIAAASDDPTGSLTTMAQAINRIQQTGMVNVRTLKSFFGQNVDMRHLLEGVFHMSTPAIQNAMRTQDKFFMAAPLMNALQDPNNPALKPFTGARLRYLSTPQGAAKEALKDVNSTITDVLNPIMMKTVAPWLMRVGGMLNDKGTQAKLQSFMSGGLDKVGHALEQAAKSAKPLIPALESMVNILPTLAAAGVHVAGMFLQLAAVTVPFIRAADWIIQKVPGVANGLMLVLGALVAYKALRTIGGYVTGFLEVLKAFKTLASAEGLASRLKALLGIGQKSTLELAGVTMQHAADKMMLAAQRMAGGKLAPGVPPPGAPPVGPNGEPKGPSPWLGFVNKLAMVGVGLKAAAGFHDVGKPPDMSEKDWNRHLLASGGFTMGDKPIVDPMSTAASTTTTSTPPSPPTTITVHVNQTFHGATDANAVKGAASQGVKDGVNAHIRSRINRGGVLHW
ncbi:MAG: hypothetical protein ACYDD7_03275, partial [Acidimicrobiales bacterium]